MIGEKDVLVIKALLSDCGLVHWHPVVLELLDRYAGLENVVEEEAHAPVPATLRLLRGMARVSARPSDEEFAALLSQLDFLAYRVRRTAADDSATFEHGENWDPTESDLKHFAEGRVVGGWRAGQSLADNRDTAMSLLLRLRQARRHERAR